MNSPGYRGYISSRMMERSVPQAVQQLVIRDYCQRNGLKFLLSATEYCMDDSTLILNNVVNDTESAGIVFFSIFQLSITRVRRLSIYSGFFRNDRTIHFAAENMRITNVSEAEKLEDIFLLRSILCAK